MNILDPKFKRHFPTYLFQCLLAALLIFAILYLTEMFSNMVVVASLGASAFIAFSAPCDFSSSPRCLLGGYAVGSLCGIALHYTSVFFDGASIMIFGNSPHILMCAAAVGLSMLIMTALNFEHPPASALAMGLVVENDVFTTVFFAIVSISVISAFKLILKRWLRDLL